MVNSELLEDTQSPKDLCLSVSLSAPRVGPRIDDTIRGCVEEREKQFTGCTQQEANTDSGRG